MGSTAHLFFLFFLPMIMRSSELMKATSYSFASHSFASAFTQLIMHNCLLFPTLSTAYVTLIKIHYTGSLLNSLTPQNT